ncbi:Hsp70 family protein [Aquabacter spiritensis]|uniref:Putative chaperone protein n=1 Tax=Aquabacter spiritensis TaxID=933073 RepID=A0A4R3M349_9HYPH|nr:Hsp70 family protein [Aquabacter spiritensis]TCT07641.1 putative chaperone protein [Aquabacter spiritensis]
MAACGLDFGTSNTTLGLAAAGGPRLAPLEGGADTLPSAIFYPRAGAPVFGRAAMAAYVGGAQGRLMRSLKAVLGSSLIDETTAVGRQRLGFRAVIGAFLAEVRARGAAAAGAPLDAVVLGRPVHFVDGDPEGDRRAEAVLDAIAEEIGFATRSFQFEPIAASLDYERQVVREELALIADIGGGTSDFSVVRLSPERRGKAERAGDILANDGVRIGGTDFDRQLSLGMVMPLLGHGAPLKRAGLSMPAGLYHDLATWSAINRLYDAKVQRTIRDLERDAAEPDKVARLARVVAEERGHTLALAAEGAKIAVAEAGETALDLDWLEAGLSVGIAHDDLLAHTGALAARIAGRIAGCLAAAGVAAGAIDAVFLTGGSTKLAHVRAAIRAAVPDARVAEGDTFGSVGTGLAIEAARRYG